jgi:1-acyl-sn-glycerol-3-phosphate acyltransferase
MICKIDRKEFQKILQGRNIGKDVFTGLPCPMILAINHINFLEVPLLVTCLYPRSFLGIVKKETWKNPIMAFLLNTYNAIPLNREGAYLHTFRKVQQAMMTQNVFVGIFPEGTRSGNGILRKGKGGIVQLALTTGVPVLPVVHYGGEKVWENIRHFKRTPFCFKVGKPFRFKYQGKPSKAVREQMLEELMGQMAALLPEPMRGEYKEQARKQSSEYLEFM